jgi:hypothetical protein
VTPFQVIEITAGIMLLVGGAGTFALWHSFSGYRNSELHNAHPIPEKTAEWATPLNATDWKTPVQQDDWEHGEKPSDVWGTYADVSNVTGQTMEHQALASEVLATLRAEAEEIPNPRLRFETKAIGVVPLPRMAPAGDPAHYNIEKLARQQEEIAMRHRAPETGEHPVVPAPVSPAPDPQPAPEPDPLDTTIPIEVDPNEPTPEFEATWAALVASGALTGIGANIDYSEPDFSDLYAAAA